MYAVVIVCVLRIDLPCLVLQVIIEGIGRVLLIRDSLPYRTSKRPHKPNEDGCTKISVSSHDMHNAQPKATDIKTRGLSEGDRPARAEDDIERGTATATGTRISVPETDETSIRSAWKSVAMVLDRLFFFIYLLLVIIALIVLFPRP